MRGLRHVPFLILAALGIATGLLGCERTGQTAIAAASAEPHPLAGEAFEGFTLIAPYLSTTTYLIDMQGEVVHSWESEETPAGGAYLARP